jgi:hypothetical protein
VSGPAWRGQGLRGTARPSQDRGSYRARHTSCPEQERPARTAEGRHRPRSWRRNGAADQPGPSLAGRVAIAAERGSCPICVRRGPWSPGRFHGMIAISQLRTVPFEDGNGTVAAGKLVLFLTLFFDAGTMGNVGQIKCLKGPTLADLASFSGLQRSSRGQF